MVDLVALKELLQPVFPLVGVVVGAAMTGFGQLYKARQERKRVIALALSDLLEVRHRVVTLNAALKYFQERGNLPVKPNEPVILICRSGSRSRAATQLLSDKAGYKTVYNVTAGLNSWIAEGKPVVPLPSALTK